MGLLLLPLSQRAALEACARWHRHHPPPRGDVIRRRGRRPATGVRRVRRSTGRPTPRRRPDPGDHPGRLIRGAPRPVDGLRRAGEGCAGVGLPPPHHPHTGRGERVQSAGGRVPGDRPTPDPVRLFEHGPAPAPTPATHRSPGNCVRRHEVCLRPPALLRVHPPAVRTAPSRRRPLGHPPSAPRARRRAARRLRRGCPVLPDPRPVVAAAGLSSTRRSSQHGSNPCAATSQDSGSSGAWEPVIY